MRPARRPKRAYCPAAAWRLLRAREAVEKARGSARGDEKIGVDIIYRALSTPIKQIADNSGIDGSVVADEVAGKPTNTGYDANEGKYVDMFKAGIIDPLKVVRSALQNAASIAGLDAHHRNADYRPQQGR